MEIHNHMSTREIIPMKIVENQISPKIIDWWANSRWG